MRRSPRAAATLALLCVLASLSIMLRMRSKDRWPRRRQMRGSKATTFRSVSSAAANQDVSTSRAAQAFLEFVRSGRTGSLRKVVGMGVTVGNDDVNVEFLSLEIREGVACITFIVHDNPSINRDPGRPEGIGFPQIMRPELTIGDDIGTIYHVFPGLDGGGSTRQWHDQIQFVPVPPADATNLHIVVHRLTSELWFGAHSRQLRQRRLVPGPWEVKVSLAD